MTWRERRRRGHLAVEARDDPHWECQLRGKRSTEGDRDTGGPRNRFRGFRQHYSDGLARPSTQKRGCGRGIQARNRIPAALPGRFRSMENAESAVGQHGPRRHSPLQQIPISPTPQQMLSFSLGSRRQ